MFPSIANFLIKFDLLNKNLILQLDSLTKYKEATAGSGGPEIVIDQSSLKDTSDLDHGDLAPLSMNGSSANGRQNLLLSCSSSSSSSSATSPARLTPEVNKKGKQVSSPPTPLYLSLSVSLSSQEVWENLALQQYVEKHSSLFTSFFD